MRRLPKRPARRRAPRHTTVTAPPTHTTVARRAPLSSSKPAKSASRAIARPLRSTTTKPGRIGRVIEDDDSTLLDLIDNLLGKGVMLNADLLLALADVDLVYIRLSALLCAADRVLPR